MHLLQRARAPDTSRASRPSADRTALGPRRAAPSIPAGVLQRCACGGGCPRCQAAAAHPSLAINTPGDAYEREADRVADAVVSGAPAAASLRGPSTATPSAAVQRCACGGSCPACSAAKDGEAELRREDAGGSAVPAVAPPVVHDVLSSPGHPLDGDTRGRMETRIGADFGGVRVHTDSRAAESARAVDAHAYTVGRDVVFGAEQYRPGTAQGDRLIAHELAHVVQQGGAEAAGAPATPAPPMLARYRRQKGSVNFGTCDSSTLKEKEYVDGDPWIEQIRVHFTSFRTESNGDVVPIGTLDAAYQGAALPPIVGVSMGGGFSSEGLTDEGDFSVLRIEGCGYHHLGVPAKEGVAGDKRHKYFSAANLANASMSFALFFRQGKSSGNQAIHKGSLGTGSLACVHVGTDDTLRQLNYHSRVSRTKVSVAYDAAVRTAACCARFKVKGFMVSNPCGKVKPASCGSKPTP